MNIFATKKPAGDAATHAFTAAPTDDPRVLAFRARIAALTVEIGTMAAERRHIENVVISQAVQRLEDVQIEALLDPGMAPAVTAAQAEVDRAQVRLAALDGRISTHRKAVARLQGQETALLDAVIGELRPQVVAELRSIVGELDAALETAATCNAKLNRLREAHTWIAMPGSWMELTKGDRPNEPGYGWSKLHHWRREAAELGLITL